MLLFRKSIDFCCIILSIDFCQIQSIKKTQRQLIKNISNYNFLFSQISHVCIEILISLYFSGPRSSIADVYNFFNYLWSPAEAINPMTEISLLKCNQTPTFWNSLIYLNSLCKFYMVSHEFISWVLKSM